MLGTVVFFYGGLVFIRGAWGELADRKPGMLTLISMGIIVAFRTSLAGTSDIDQTAATATREQLLPRLASEDIVIAGPHMNFPALGRLRKEGSGYSWAPVVFTDQWDEK